MRLALGVLLALTLAPRPAAQPTTRWVSGSGDRLTEVAGYTVVSYRDAGDGGLDWALVGGGEASGWGSNQLWMVGAPLSARTALAVPSDAVAFMMDGDRNDGFATFLVDSVPVGTFDMFMRGNATLVVEGLPQQRHVIEVRLDGTKRARASAPHVAVWGGSALVRERVAAR